MQGVCHVNGPSWFSGGTSLTRPAQYALYNMYTYCTMRFWVLYNMSLRIIQMSLRIVQMSCTLCTRLSRWTMGHLSAGALLIEFLHRGDYLNESCAKNNPNFGHLPKHLIFCLVAQCPGSFIPTSLADWVSELTHWIEEEKRQLQTIQDMKGWSKLWFRLSI